MALAQLLNRSCNSPDVVFRTIRDFLAAANGIDDFSPAGPNPGPGYEIVDESYASGDPADTTTGDWCVMRSHGESGTYPHYLRLVFGATIHQAWLYLDWNAQTHTGFAPVGTTSGNIYHNGAGQVLMWLHADLDEIHLIIKPQDKNDHYWVCFGRIKPNHLAYSGEAVQVAAAIDAGEGTTIALPTWPDWAAVGKRIYCWDTASLHEIEITAVSEPDRTITVAQSWAKSAGAWLAEDLLLICHRSSSYGVRARDILVGMPARAKARSGDVTQENYYVSLLYYMWAQEEKYGKKLSVDALIARPNEYRGRLALMRDADTWGATGGQGVAWEDEDGLPWRVYSPYGGNIILREAI